MGRKIITFNAHITNPPRRVRRAVRYFRLRYRPDVINIQEATRCHGKLGKLGFHVIQNAPRRGAHGVDEAANIAVLVAKRHKVLSHESVRLRKKWAGPKHGWLHPGRVYQLVVVGNKKGKRILTNLALHQPFGRIAQNESRRRISTILKAGTGARTRAAVGDWNEDYAAVGRFAAHFGAIEAGNSVDRAVVTNAEKITRKRLGRHGSDHHAVLFKITPKKHKKAKRPKKHKPTVAHKVLAVAAAQVGYHEGRSNGHWNNIQKYSKAVPGLEWSNGQPWCATFVSWCALKAKAEKLYPRTASTDAGAAWWKARHRWSEYPAIGAQGYLGRNGDMYHTFLVEKYDRTYVYTIEGNTNDNGSAEGDGVYRHKRLRRSSEIQGYGYPAFPEGIKSADPAWKGRK